MAKKLVSTSSIIMELKDSMFGRHRLKKPFIERDGQYFFNVDDLNDVLVIINGETWRYIYVNTAIKALRGFTPEEVISQPIEKVMTTDNLEIAFSQLREKLLNVRAGKDRLDSPLALEIENIRKDGSTVWSEVVLDFFRDRHGKIKNYIIGVNRDISRRKAAEDALRRSEKNLNDIIQGSPVATFVINQEHKVTHWNVACEALTGTKATDVVGSSKHWKWASNKKRPLLADLIVNNCSEKEILSHYSGTCHRSALVAGAYTALRFSPALGENGKWLSVTASPLKNEHQEIIGAIETIQDVTDQRIAEDALRKSRSELEMKVEERTSELEEANIALKVLLRQVEKEKNELEHKMVLNLKELILPLIERLENLCNTNQQRNLLGVIRSNIDTFSSSFLKGLLTNFVRFSPLEIQVGNLVVQGKSTDEIADLLNLSPRTIESYRKKIREKAGIKNKKINLRSFLKSQRWGN